MASGYVFAPQCFFLKPGKHDLKHAERDALNDLGKRNREARHSCSQATKATFGTMTGVMIFFGVCRTLARAHACSARHVSWLWTKATGPADVARRQEGPSRDHLIPAHTQSAETLSHPHMSSAELRFQELSERMAPVWPQSRATPSLSAAASYLLDVSAFTAHTMFTAVNLGS